MSVSAGQAVKASVVNEAFISRKVNSSTTGILSLLNTAPESGPVVSNVQEKINELLERKSEVETELSAINDEIANHDTRISENTAEINAVKGKGNITSADDPTVTDDSAAGYYIGTIWKNTTSGVYFFCDDNTEGAAVWSEIETGGGGGVASVTLVLSDRVIDDEDSLLIVDCFSFENADITVTLPSIIVDTPRTLYIKKIDSSDHKVIVSANGSDTIEGGSTTELPYQWDGITLVSTNYGWVIL